MSGGKYAIKEQFSKNLTFYRSLILRMDNDWKLFPAFRSNLFSAKKGYPLQSGLDNF